MDYETKQEKRLKQSKVILFLGIILIIAAPFVLTRSWGIISFDDTGQIGDTIGGVTAPIVNLIGAVLVYFAFLVQLDANKLVFQQIKDEKHEQRLDQNRNYVFELFKLLKEELYSFSIIDERSIGSGDNRTYVLAEYKGLEAIDKMLINLMSEHGSFGNELYKMKEFESIIELLKKFLSTLRDVEIKQIDRKFFVESVEYMYLSKIKASIDELIKPCESCGQVHHGNPSKLTELGSSIEFTLKDIKESYSQPKF